mmetsp:Transcript_5022/g.12058  ORF Transcript_5022/g.12058 Transcript_5022/m.12058 type:complete len:225 (+) Transcript_5022:1353-2027(+)
MTGIPSESFFVVFCSFSDSRAPCRSFGSFVRSSGSRVQACDRVGGGVRAVEPEFSLVAVSIGLVVQNAIDDDDPGTDGQLGTPVSTERLGQAVQLFPRYVFGPRGCETNGNGGGVRGQRGSVARTGRLVDVSETEGYFRKAAARGGGVVVVVVVAVVVAVVVTETDFREPVRKLQGPLVELGDDLYPPRGLEVIGIQEGRSDHQEPIATPDVQKNVSLSHTHGV